MRNIGDTKWVVYFFIYSSVSDLISIFTLQNNKIALLNEICFITVAQFSDINDILGNFQACMFLKNFQQ